MKVLLQNTAADNAQLIWVYWIMIVAYLAFLALAGVYAKRKTKTLEDFMVAGRTIGPILLGLSFGVTYFSAVMIVGGGQYSWLWGLAAVWIAAIDVFVGVFLVFVMFGKRTTNLGEHFESMTVPQMLAKRYQDDRIQTFTSVTILIFETIYLVSIYMGLALLISVIMPGNELAYIFSVVICAVITIVYLNIGGAHGAIFTDAAESIIMLVGVLFIFFFGITAVGGFDGLLNTVADIEQASGLEAGYYSTFPGGQGASVIGFMLVTSFGVWGMPQMISRFYTAKKQRRTLKWGLVISCVWAFAVSIFAWFNGVISRAYFYVNHPEKYAEMVSGAGATAVPDLMFYTLPPILAGLFIAAVTAASLTTGEKVIMIAASGFSIDVYQQKTGASDDKTLLVTKITTTIIVVIAAFLAILQPGAVLALCMFAWSAMAATILIPYVFGLFWKGGTAKAALWSGAVALASAILWFLLFRGARAWAAVGLTYPQLLADIGGTHVVSFKFFDGVTFTFTVAAFHEFIVSQVAALIAFPVISHFTKSSRPSKEFLQDIFKVMKSDEEGVYPDKPKKEKAPKPAEKAKETTTPAE